MTGPARTAFLGSGEFAIPVLGRLAGSPLVELAVVVSAPPRPRGRKAVIQHSPVAAWAVERGLNLLTPQRLRAPDTLAALESLKPELIVLADYGQIVPAALLELPRHAALNLHPSLLPRHRGATPVPAAILAGDGQTGVSLIQMDAGLDSGPIIAQRRLALRGDETTPELERQLAALAADVLDESLGPWLAGEIEPRPQPARGATMTRPLQREDGRLEPGRPALELERQVRAHQPWPGSFLETPVGRLVVWRSGVLPGAGLGPGELVSWTGDDRLGHLGLATIDGTLELHEVQPAGGRRMTAAELLRGRPGLARALPTDVSARWR